MNAPVSFLNPMTPSGEEMPPISKGNTGKFGGYSSARTVEGMTRDEICKHYERKVLLIARRIAERLPSESIFQVEDLISCGAVGLLEAFERYDPKHSTQFSTFAEYRIRGAILDALRGSDHLPRRRRDLLKKIDHHREQLRQRLGRTPLESEVAEEMELDLESYQSAVAKTQSVVMVSIDSPDEDSGRSLLETLRFGELLSEEDRISTQQLKNSLQESVQALPDRARQCILMYYGRDLSLAEIGLVFEVTPSRISQILSSARKVLRRDLERRLSGRAEDILEWRL